MLMSRLRTHTHTDGNVKVEQYSAEAESAIGKYLKVLNLLGQKTVETALYTDGSAVGGAPQWLVQDFSIIWPRKLHQLGHTHCCWEKK